MIKPWLKFNTGLMALCAVVLVACNENETPIDPGTGTAPNAPTALMAQSQSQAVGLKWTVSSTGATPTSYVIEYNEAGTTTMLTKTVSSATATTATVDGLTNGVVYEFVVYAMNGTAKSPASPKVSWAPANRGTGAYRLYSSRNSTQGSGLAIFSGSAPAVKKVAEGSTWDICFDDVTESADPRLASPGQTNYVEYDASVDDLVFRNNRDQIARITRIGDQLSGITSFDDMYESAALSIPTEEKFYSLNSIGGTANWGCVLVHKETSASPNYQIAKVLVKRGTDGKFVQGTGANAYIDVEVSYQTTQNVPYAIKQRLDQGEGVARANRSSVQAAR